MSAVVLLSGGVDSTVLARQAYEQDILHACLFYDWGQSAMLSEQWSAQRIAHNLDVECIVKTLPLCAAAMNDGVGSRVVPGRNTIFCALAANLFADVDEIWIGSTKGDRFAYWDCSGTWLTLMNNTLHGIAEGAPVHLPMIAAPLLGMTKSEVVAEGNRLGLHWEDSFSCYDPPEFRVPCGKCNACIERDAVL